MRGNVNIDKYADNAEMQLRSKEKNEIQTYTVARFKREYPSYNEILTEAQLDYHIYIENKLKQK
jgi:uncharacterized protein (DUF2344 family)